MTTTDPRTAVLIGSVGRSGSTILDLMLSNRSDGRSVGEIAAAFRPWRTHHFDPDCSCGQKLRSCPAWAGVDLAHPRRFHRSLVASESTTLAVDSSKDLAWILDANRWCRRSGVSVVNVLLWKEPKALAHSMWRRGNTAGAWRRPYLAYYGRYLASALPYVSVPYAALVEAPQATLGRVLSMAGRELEDGQERFWENDAHYAFGSGTIRWEPLAATSFPSEFEEAWEPQEHALREDATITALLAALRGDGTEWPRRWSDRSIGGRPIWYAKSRVVRLGKRFRPAVLPAAVVAGPTSQQPPGRTS